MGIMSLTKATKSRQWNIVFSGLSCIYIFCLSGLYISGKKDAKMKGSKLLYHVRTEESMH
jgi:hypothetical protein